ncbi:MAG TPA: ATP-binding protein [Pirellulales bacterium]|nr:ATP-binding protein [Pirellulales bacterium]
MARWIPHRESLTVEFKSDRSRLPDRELVTAAVCLANTEGGEIYIGVEDDGTPSGLHAAHQNITSLAALIANSTTPPLSVRVEALDVDGRRVAKILVPKSRQLVATSEGLLQRRRIKADGLPECIPFYPHEFARRQSDLGLVDYSALPIAGASLDDFDPLERERLRQFVARYHGDASLLGLRDDELDGALGLVAADNGRPVPTVAGLLLVGREPALRRHIPTHEVAFQVLEGTDVRVNDFCRAPLLKTFERVEEQFAARVVENEIEIDLFRVPIPKPRHRPDLSRTTSLRPVCSKLQPEQFRHGSRSASRWRGRFGPFADHRRGGKTSVQSPARSLIALVLLRQERRVDTTRLARQIQRADDSARQVLERLLEAGLVQAHGVKKGRTYTLSPRVYKDLGQPAGYVRQAGFEPIQQEQMVLKYVQAHQRIARKDVVALCGINDDQARRMLRKLASEKKLKPEGKGRATGYVVP